MNEKLEIQMLRDSLTANELAAATAKIAEETASMSVAEKKAFLKGLSLATSCLQVGRYLQSFK